MRSRLSPRLSPSSQKVAGDFHSYIRINRFGGHDGVPPSHSTCSLSHCGSSPYNRRSDLVLKCLSRARLLVGCLSSDQHASLSQGRIYEDNLTCCHTEIKTFYLTQSQYTDTGSASPSADPTSPGTWQGSHWSGLVEVTGITRHENKNPLAGGIRTPDLLL